MSDFKYIQNLIILWEGTKYTNNPSDLGGPTKYGISERAYPHLDIENLTLEEALPIYKSDYWDKYKLGLILKQSLANKIFLMLINMNPSSATVCVQSAINAVGGVVIMDGIFGTKTLTSLNLAPQDWLMDRIRLELCKHYAGRVRDNKTQITNLEGWIWRAIA